MQDQPVGGPVAVNQNPQSGEHEQLIHLLVDGKIPEPDQTPDKKFLCPDCDVTFDYKRNYYAHWRHNAPGSLRHMSSASSTTSPPSASAPTTSSVGSRRRQQRQQQPDFGAHRFYAATLADADSLYSLPADAAEKNRLHLQHIVLRHLYGTLFHAPLRATFESGGNVLDVGCGSASWSLDVSRLFPRTSVSAVRLLFLSIPADSWPGVIRELARVTKPGGYVEVHEFSCRVFYFDPKNRDEVREALEDDGPLGKLGWNGPLGKLCWTDLRGALAGIMPLMLEPMGLSAAEYEALCEDAGKDG
ncbi:hypothetical protein HK405_006842, partial [Cladochytrium tenue]